MAESTPSAQPPLEREPPRRGTPSAAAAGIPAVAKTARLVGAMGVMKGARALLDVNQQDGFDCQSCAWPSPDSDRHLFEFCENGVKALSSEATKNQITSEFFRAHSIDELREQTDFWLEQQGRLLHPVVKREGATHYEAISWHDAF